MEKTFDKSIFYLFIFAFIIILIILNNSAFNDNLPTCNNFVVNVYLYLALSICSIAIFSYLINYVLFGKSRQYYRPLELYEILNSIGSPFYIFSIIMTFVLIILIAFSNGFDNNNVGYNHVIWFLFLFFISVTIYPKFKDITTYNYVDNALLITSIIFIVMTYFYYMFSDLFLNNMSSIGMGLLVSLIVIVIVELINLLFFKRSQYFLSFFKITSYLVIILFSVFVSYDTAEMAIREKECTSLPNYPKFSIDFFMDILNIFSRTLFLKSTK